jgi:4'-phosphopantetheinyl transferase
VPTYSETVTSPGPTVVIVAETELVVGSLPGEPLGAAAQTRCDRLRSPADRADFTAARLLAVTAHRVLTGHALPVAEIVQRCEVCGGPHGRPRPTASGAHLSWSHAHGYVAAAAGRGRLGVDIEPLAAVDDSLAAMALTPDEQSLAGAGGRGRLDVLLAWTAKEAAVKAGLVELDGVSAFTVLADRGSLVSGVAGFEFSAHRTAGFTAAAATPGPARWLTLDPDGEPTVLDPRAVGGAA